MATLVSYYGRMMMMIITGPPSPAKMPKCQNAKLPPSKCTGYDYDPPYLEASGQFPKDLKKMTCFIRSSSCAVVVDPLKRAVVPHDWVGQYAASGRPKVLVAWSNSRNLRPVDLADSLA